MRIVIKIAGQCFYTKKDNETLPHESAEALSKALTDANSLHVELDDGSHLVLGPDLIKKAIFIIEPTTSEK